MERRTLGTSGVDVPVIGFGTSQVFDLPGEKGVETARRVVDAALDAGSDLFDTSPMYGRARPVLADAVADRRDALLVADKVWTHDDREADEQIRGSLDLFGGRVDVFQVHNLAATEARLRTLARLRDEGKVRAVGVTHYTPGAFDAVAEWMRDERVQMIQVPYNARSREAERALLPLAEEMDVGVIANVPLGSGRLVGRAPPREALERFAPYGVTSWPQVLLKWIVSDPRVTCAIPATADPDHARQDAVAGAPPWFEETERERVARLAGDA